MNVVRSRPTPGSNVITVPRSWVWGVHHHRVLERADGAGELAEWECALLAQATLLAEVRDHLVEFRAHVVAAKVVAEDDDFVVVGGVDGDAAEVVASLLFEEFDEAAMRLTSHWKWRFSCRIISVVSAEVAGESDMWKETRPQNPLFQRRDIKPEVLRC
jgi:hypothetical protein